MKDVEEFENILTVAQDGKVCVYNQGGATYLGLVLDKKVMGVLKEIL